MGIIDCLITKNNKPSFEKSQNRYVYIFSKPFQRSKKFSILIRFNPPNLVPNFWDNSKFVVF
jgi:hypothetical protein